MNWQHRHGAPARTRLSDHTVWERTSDDQWMPAWVWALMGLIAAALFLAFLPELKP